MLRIRDVVSATVFRFLPSAAITMAALVALVGSRAVSVSFAMWIYIGTVVVQHTIGFGMTLLVYRRRLGEDAGVSGRRTVLAGVFGPVLLMVAAKTGSAFIPAREAWIAWGLMGAVAGAVMYWPWLRRRPSERGLDISNADQLVEISHAKSLPLDAAVPREALKAGAQRSTV